MKEVVCLAAIKKDAELGDSILLVLEKEKLYWMLPGGKKVNGESYEDCLERELDEELPMTKVRVRGPLGNFQGETPNSKLPVSAEVFLGEYLSGPCVAEGEIAGATWVRRRKLKEFRLTNITQKVIWALKQIGKF